MTQSNFKEELEKLNINLTNQMEEQLEKYYSMLIEYNKIMNLTGITEKESVYLKHYYDSLTLNKIIDLNKIDTLCDVGTGAGFPGIVIKIVFPHIKITLIDSLNKRIQFLNQVIKELGLKDIEAIHARIEEYGIKNREKYDLVTARAVAPLNILLEYSIPLVKVDKYFIAMKSNIDEEIKNINHISKELDIKEEKVVEFLLPYENSKRTLLCYKKMNKTNKKYPRKYSVIKQKPL